MRDQAVIDDAKAKIEEARQEIRKAEQRFNRIFNAQTKRITAEYAKEEMTLALALEPYMEDHAVSNVAGHKFLQDLTWHGAWKGKGLMANGGYWTETTQQMVQVAIGAAFSDAQLDELALMIATEVVPVVRPGALKSIDKAFKDAKAIDIFEDDCAETRSPVLLVFPDDHVEIVDQRYYRPNWRQQQTKFTGTLRDALTYVRDHFPYN